MIRAQQWFRVPSEPVLEALPLMSWRPASGRSPAGETAALLVYVALIFSSDTDDSLPPHAAQIAEATYDELQLATGLSRKLVADGLARLIELSLIKPVGSHQQRRYLIMWKEEGRGWFKLPCRAILREQKILPFMNFTLRSKHELHAMKLYLFLAARRRNENEESFASYETIYERTGIPEKDIRKAISLLLVAGLLRSVDRHSDVGAKAYGHNKYYFAGSERLRGAESVSLI